MIAGSCKSDRPINFTGVKKVPLKCDCIIGSIINGVRGPILCSFALSSAPGHKIYKELKIKLFENIKNLFYLKYNFFFNRWWSQTRWFS